jgi:putative peptidoglycan lipid II flippase
LGFARDAVIARLFGVYIYAQAFVVAFRIPNLLRDLLAEGAANAAIVPVFSEYQATRSKEEFWQLCNVVLNLLLTALCAATMLGILGAPLIVRLIAPGFAADPQKLAATITLTRIIFPYILLIGLAAYATAILNSLRHFAVPALAPCLLNISIIACAVIFGEGISGLASGVLIGGVLQLLVQLPVLWRKGLRLKLFRRFRHPAAKGIIRLMVPRFFSSGIYQLNNFVDSIFGSLVGLVGEGGVAVLYFAYRLIQFPLGIFSTALAQAALPSLAVQALEPGRAELKHTLQWSLRATFFLMLPVSAGLIVLSRPLVALLFGGGRFDGYAQQATAATLCFYALGLFAYAAVKILQSGFFALKDTLTPAKISALALGLNILFNLLFALPLKICGVALATSLSGIISFLVLFSLLRARLKPLGMRPLAISFLKILAASLGMGLVCFLVYRQIGSGVSLSGRLMCLAFIAAAAGFSYVAFAFIFRVAEMQQLWKWLVKKKIRCASAA